MRETETRTTLFASPAWLGGVFKYYQLESGGLRWLHKSSQMSPDRIFSFPSSQSQVLLAHRQAEAAWLGTAHTVTAATAAPAPPHIRLSVINPLLGLEDLQQAFKPSPGSVCLKHHSLECGTSGHGWQTSHLGCCTVRHQPWTAPSHPNQSFHLP